MAAKHKIVAYKLDGRRDGILVSSLTQSPRGTRVISGSVSVDTKGKSKEELERALEEAFKQLQQGT